MKKNSEYEFWKSMKNIHLTKIKNCRKKLEELDAENDTLTYDHYENIMRDSEKLLELVQGKLESSKEEVKRRYGKHI